VIHVFGRVQGVWFRAFTKNQAQRYSVSGWVKNMTDGSVYCEAQGSEENMRLFLRELRRGSELSKVEKVVVKNATTSESFVGFEVKH